MSYRFFKKKVPIQEAGSELRQCLNVFDLTMLGVGSIVGSGLFVVTGILARNVAGPAVIFSFLIAAIPALIAALCYAEFASRIPRVGANYVYTHVALGEIWAFIAGWNYLVDNIVVSAALARSSSEYIDSFTGGKVYQIFSRYLHWGNSKDFSAFPDLLAVTVLVLVLVFVILGVWHSAAFVNIITCTKLAVILFMIVVGIYFANPDNWSTPEKFAPYGVVGIFAASAQCFFAFGGIDTVAMAAEEASKRRNTRLAIYLALTVSISIYVCIAALLTLMTPFSSISEYAPLANAYGKYAFPVAKYVVSVGALCATLSGLLTAVFITSRVVYAMAADGLLPACLAKVSQSTQVPIHSAVTCGAVIIITTLMLNLQELVELTSIGLIISYIMLAVAIILTRYQPGVQSVTYESLEDLTKRTSFESGDPTFNSLSDDIRTETEYRSLRQLFDNIHTDKDSENANVENSQQPSERTSLIATVCMFSAVLCLTALCALLSHGWVYVILVEPWAVICAGTLLLLVVVSLVLLCVQPRNQATFPYMVPCVPAVPILSVVVDAIMLVNMSYMTYMRFVIFLVFGKYYKFVGYQISKLLKKTFDKNKLTTVFY